MTTLTVLAALAVAASPTGQSMKLASTGFSAVNVDDKTSDFFAEFFAQQLQQRGISVTTKEAVAAVVGLERQKELLGCSTESKSCLAELAGALGVDALVVGSLAKFSGQFVVNLKIVSAKNGETMLADSARVDSDTKLLDFFTNAAEKWAPSLRKGAPPPPTPPSASTSKPPPSLPMPPPPSAVSQSTGSPPASGGPGVVPWLVTGGGGVLLLGSALSFAAARNAEDDLRSGFPLTNEQAVIDLRREGEGFQTASRVMLVGGLIAAGVGGYLFLASGPKASAAIVPVEGGAVFAFGGVLP